MFTEIVKYLYYTHTHTHTHTPRWGTLMHYVLQSNISIGDEVLLL
jgi:hypothetical protein